MTETDRAAILQDLTILAELFKCPLSAAVQQLYLHALDVFPVADVRTAIATAAQTCKFFPKPVELREMICGSVDDEIEDAWQEYKRLARVEGGYASPEMDSVLADALVTTFGSWERACWEEFSPEMWASTRKAFDRAYRLHLARTPEPQTRRLIGFCARDNQLRGYAPPTEALELRKPS